MRDSDAPKKALRALVIDDGEADRTYLRSLLKKKFGVIVAEARNGLEGLQEMERETPDFVVLDLNMPIMSGSEVLEALRSCQHYSHLPVIVLTAAKSKRVFSELTEMGVSDYILKPLDYDFALSRFSLLIDNIKSEARGLKRLTVRFTNRDKVLVACADENFLKFCSNLLEKRFGVLTAQSGAEGLEVFLSEQPRLVLIGEDLPLLNEEMLAGKLRESAGNDVRVVLLSRDNSAEYNKDLFNGHIAQTFVPDVFLERFNAFALEADDPADDPRQYLTEQLPQEIYKAVNQTIGVMAQSEVRIAKTDLARNILLELEAHTLLEDSGKNVTAELILCTSRIDGNNLTTLVLGSKNPSRTDCAELFGELVRTIAGKLRATFERSSLMMEEKRSNVDFVEKAVADYDAGSDSVMVFQTDSGQLLIVALTVTYGD